jgi:hypothetical protein
MELKKLMIDSKAAWVDFPGMPGFSVEVVNLSKKELQALRKSATDKKFDKKSRSVIESLDEEKFVKEYTSKTIKNWKGLTLEYLQALVLIDTSGQDLSSELEYTPENAETLLNSSQEFDAWLNEVVFDLDNFRN